MKIITQTLLISILLFITLYPKIRIYGIYSPSHEILKDEWFLPSIQDDFEVILQFVDQTCKSGKYMKKGWTQTTIKKIDLIITAIKDNWNDIFIFSDVDIQFFQPIEQTIKTLMQDNDLLVQKDHANILCTGFFACRANEKTLQLWSDIKEYMSRNKKMSDQKTLNYFIHKRNVKYQIKWNFLPETFFCGGTFDGIIWKPGNNLHIPKNIMIHHANWTIGIENKIAQLQYVKKRKLNE